MLSTNPTIGCCLLNQGPRTQSCASQENSPPSNTVDLPVAIIFFAEATEQRQKQTGSTGNVLLMTRLKWQGQEP